MKKVYQTIIDKGNGNCWQAAIASLLELELEEVPHFLEAGVDSFKVFDEFLLKHGYEYTGMLHNKYYNMLYHIQSDCFDGPNYVDSCALNLKNLKKEEGIDGFFFASVLSPKYFNLNEGIHKTHTTHAVIIDQNCNIVHDVNPEYAALKQYPLAPLLKYNGIITVSLIDKL